MISDTRRYIDLMRGEMRVGYDTATGKITSIAGPSYSTPTSRLTMAKTALAELMVKLQSDLSLCQKAKQALEEMP